jgi:hypothetical protein
MVRASMSPEGTPLRPHQYEPGDGNRCDVKPVVEAGSVEGGIQHRRHQVHCPAAGEPSRLIHFFDQALDELTDALM